MAAEERKSLDDALIGRTIAGKYVIKERVGGGGMGSVYKARQVGLDKVVAVKVLHRELLAEPTFATRFKREATSASRIDHPASLRVLDFGEEPDGILFIAMEFLEGRTLFKVLREEAPLAPARIVDLSRQILAALAAAHDLGIVHRDLKPENVIVLAGKDDEGNPSEHVKVCDFGIAKLAAHDEQTDEKLTVEGSIVGTPEYLSPEQARGGQLDARSDLYSMGVIVFEMLTGQPPFRGDTPLAIVLKHLDAVPPKPSSLTPKVDPAIEAVCLKALSKSPEGRYATAREMRAALVTEARTSAPPPPSQRLSEDLVMAQTPPPVSSTQAPVPLTARRPPAQPAGRPLLASVGEQSTGGTSRALASVVVVALLAGGAGAYWAQKHGSSHGPPVAAAQGPVITPQVPPPATAAPESPSSEAPLPSMSAAASGPFSPPQAGVPPPSELPVAAPSASAHHHHHHAADKEPVAADSAAPQAGVPADTSAAPLPPDLAPTPPPPPLAAAKVSFSSFKVSKVDQAAFRAALPSGAMGRCYRAASGSHAAVVVHFVFTGGKGRPETEIPDPSLAGLAGCINGVADPLRVAGAEDGATADVQVDLDAP